MARTVDRLKRLMADGDAVAIFKPAIRLERADLMQGPWSLIILQPV